MARVCDEPLEQGEHEPRGAGDASGERRERVGAGRLDRRQVLLERLGEAVDRYLLPAGTEFVAVDLGKDAIAAGAGEHLQESPERFPCFRG